MMMITRLDSYDFSNNDHDGYDDVRDNCDDDHNQMDEYDDLVDM